MRHPWQQWARSPVAKAIKETSRVAGSRPVVGNRTPCRRYAWRHVRRPAFNDDGPSQPGVRRYRRIAVRRLVGKRHRQQPKRSQQPGLVRRSRGRNAHHRSHVFPDGGSRHDKGTGSCVIVVQHCQSRTCQPRSIITAGWNRARMNSYRAGANRLIMVGSCRTITTLGAVRGSRSARLATSRAAGQFRRSQPARFRGRMENKVHRCLEPLMSKQVQPGRVTRMLDAFDLDTYVIKHDRGLYPFSVLIDHSPSRPGAPSRPRCGDEKSPVRRTSP